jgi:hypothetical protein
MRSIAEAPPRLAAKRSSCAQRSEVAGSTPAEANRVRQQGTRILLVRAAHPPTFRIKLAANPPPAGSPEFNFGTLTFPDCTQ